ncbi:serine hydrolase domain-containing protein [Nocardioides sp. Root190]|uniref:serine hydrolase domain-containing protein n=1 Tax=Nocardioides sp. Root190 TaxID=1736488 RepID=UPI000ACD43DD|nr:serine hydrolase domain-containing protein [Nocardioides sp. Root190]
MRQGYDDTLASLQGAGRLPSVSAAVARGGEPVWQGCVSAMPGVDVHSAYRIGSITKTMTAVLVLQLRDEGRCSLDEPIGRFVPEAGYAEVTLRELLAHTGGLQSEPVGPWWERVDGPAVAELLLANDGSGRVAGRGEFFHYSNLGFALLGEAVARLRGQTWWDAVRARVLEPLAMTATSYGPPTHHAPGHSVDQFAHTLSAEPHADTGAMAPAGQLWSTVADLLRWADFLAAGHPGVLGADTLAEMATHAEPADAYGLGLRLLDVGARAMVGHTGSMPGFQASLFVDRATRDAVAVLTNATTGLRAEHAPGAFLDGAVAPAPPWTPPWTPSSVPVPGRVAEVLGLWFWGNTAFTFEWVGGELLAHDLRTGELHERFVIRGDDVVGAQGYHRGERLVTHRDAAGGLLSLECATFVYTRVPYDARVTIPGGHPSPERP